MGFHPRYWNLKRGLGYLNWHRGRRRVHYPTVADLIVADLKAHSPDHIAVTGDLANLGLPLEYERALSWLGSLGDGDQVSVVPGNHDIYTARLHGASCLETWRRYMMPDDWGAKFADGGGAFPFVRRLGCVALIGLNSAIPTPPFVAAGRLGARQLSELARVLDALAGAGLARIVLIHHPPLPGQASRRRGLEDAAEFERVIEAHGAELVLHGHNHTDMLSWRQWARGHIPVVGVASGSAGKAHKSEPPARYNLIRITPGGDRFEIEIRSRGLAEPGGEIVDLSRSVLNAPVVREGAI
jgi:3',5'-cyclic AMP phosphodiesterase CpdA